jgi:guanylate kinase
MTHTTRPRRHNEVEGVDYAFETPQSFAANHYIEDVTYAGYQYGSSYESLYAAWDKAAFASIVLDTKRRDHLRADFGAGGVHLIFDHRRPGDLEVALVGSR